MCCCYFICRGMGVLKPAVVYHDVCVSSCASSAEPVTKVGSFLLSFTENQTVSHPWPWEIITFILSLECWPVHVVADEAHLPHSSYNFLSSCVILQQTLCFCVELSSPTYAESSRAGSSTVEFGGSGNVNFSIPQQWMGRSWAQMVIYSIKHLLAAAALHEACSLAMLRNDHFMLLSAHQLDATVCTAGTAHGYAGKGRIQPLHVRNRDTLIFVLQCDCVLCYQIPIATCQGEELEVPYKSTTTTSHTYLAFIICCHWRDKYCFKPLIHLPDCTTLYG